MEYFPISYNEQPHQFLNCREHLSPTYTLALYAGLTKMVHQLGDHRKKKAQMTDLAYAPWITSMSYHDRKYKLLWYEHAHPVLLPLFYFKLSQIVSQVCVFVLSQCSSGGNKLPQLTSLFIWSLTWRKSGLVLCQKAHSNHPRLIFEFVLRSRGWTTKATETLANLFTLHAVACGVCLRAQGEERWREILSV